MRILIFALFIGISINGMAQNGGQYPENNSVKLEWAGTSVKVTNKQSCESVIHVSYAQSDVDLTIAGNSSVIFMPPAAVATIKAKNTTNCGNSDYGLVELSLTAMPLKFVNFDLTNDYGTLCTVKFTVAEVDNVHHFNILVSTDGIIWTKKDSVKTIPNGTIYSSVLNFK